MTLPASPEIAFAVTPIYAGLLGLLFVGLSLWVVARRVRARAASGDGGDPALSDAIRAHGNFAEYVPLALILMAMGEALGMPALALQPTAAPCSSRGRCTPPAWRAGPTCPRCAAAAGC